MTRAGASFTPSPIIATRFPPASGPLVIADAKDHVDRLSTALATFGAATRRGIDEATEAHDADTADLLTEVSRGVDKHPWMVEAHLQTAR